MKSSKRKVIAIASALAIGTTGMALSGCDKNKENDFTAFHYVDVDQDNLCYTNVFEQFQDWLNDVGLTTIEYANIKEKYPNESISGNVVKCGNSRVIRLCQVQASHYIDVDSLDEVTELEIAQDVSFFGNSMIVKHFDGSKEQLDLSAKILNKTK